MTHATLSATRQRSNYQQVNVMQLKDKFIIVTGSATGIGRALARRCVAEGARVLASSEKCPVEAWAMGLRTYGLQYHPEISVDSFSKWAADDPRGLEEVGMKNNG